MHRRSGPAAPSAVLLAAWLAGALGGCESYFDHSPDAGSDAGADVAAPMFSGAAVGGACAATADCRRGLACKASTCQAIGTTPSDGACLLSAECAKGLHCGWAGFCAAQPSGQAGDGAACESSQDCAAGLYCNLAKPGSCAAGTTCGTCTATGTAPEGEACTATAGCPPGLVCNLVGLAGTCARPKTPGQDIGGACQTTLDCLAGLACSASRKQCVPGSLPLNPDLYPGIECDDEGEAALPFQAIVRLPRAGQAADFYALPFPSDIRKKGGSVDVSAHPSPGAGLLGFDAVRRVIDAMNGELAGWSLTTAMYVRFSRALDPKSITVTGADAAVRLVHLDSGATVPIEARFHPQRNKYICGNWLYVHARWSELLEPGAAYALVVTDAVKPAPEVTGDKALVQSADLQLLLADAAPADKTLEPAWATHAKLRTWLKKTGLPSKKVAAATVFTTAESRTRTQQLFQTAQAALKPEIVGTPVVCAKGTVSPCATPEWAKTVQGAAGKPDPRGCPATPPTTHLEIHFKLRLPYYQKGKRPYLDAGGELALQDGKPAVVDYEEVCTALTLPKAAMPAAGWPLLIFAHGTGGSFRSGADQVAGQVSPLTLGGAQIRYATLGIDQPMHANRRGAGITLDPGPLFYNFTNPKAARGNFYQGAADNFALVRWAKAFAGTIPSVLGTVKFDPGNHVFMGHSQGATTGPMFLPYQPGLKGAVLSGAGGSLVYGLLGKKKPYDASLGLRIGLQEVQIDADHPVLNLFQSYFEPSDPLVYAPLLFAKPVAGQGPLPVLHTIGEHDSFTPVSTSLIFAAAMRSVLAGPAPLPAWLQPANELAMTLKAPPIVYKTANVQGVSVAHSNAKANSVKGVDYDGHFVAFNDKTAVKQVLSFLGTLVQGNPTVVK